MYQHPTARWSSVVGFPVRLRKGATFLLRPRGAACGAGPARCVSFGTASGWGCFALGASAAGWNTIIGRPVLFQHLGLRGHGRQQTVCPRLLTQSFQLGVLLPQCHHFPLTGVKPGLVTADLRIGSGKTAVQQLRLSGLAREPSPDFRFDLRHRFLHFLHPAQSAAVFTGSGGTITLHTAQHTGPCGSSAIRCAARCRLVPSLSLPPTRARDHAPSRAVHTVTPINLLALIQDRQQLIVVTVVAALFPTGFAALFAAAAGCCFAAPAPDTSELNTAPVEAPAPAALFRLLRRPSAALPPPVATTVTRISSDRFSSNAVPQMMFASG